MILLRMQRAPIIGRALQAAALLGAAFAVAMPAAHAAELQTLVSIALRKPVSQMVAAFEKRSGHKVKVTIAPPRAIVAMLDGGMPADIVVNTDGAMNELRDKGLIRREVTPLATTGFGFATRTNDAAPDISTADGVRQALLAAGKIIYNDPKLTPSGQLMLQIAERLGVAEAVKAKSEVVASGTNIAALAKDRSTGTVMAFSVLVEVPGHAGVKLVGPLPRELQTPLPYSAALGGRVSDDAAANALLQALASPEAKKAYAATGFEVDQ